MPENNRIHSLDIAFSSSAACISTISPAEPIVMAYGWTRAINVESDYIGGGEQTAESITLGDTFYITFFDTDQSAEAKFNADINITSVTISVIGEPTSPFNYANGETTPLSWSHNSGDLRNSNPGLMVNPSTGCKVMGRSWRTPDYTVARTGKFKITVDLVLSVGGTEKKFRVDPEVDIEGAG